MEIEFKTCIFTYYFKEGIPTPSPYTRELQKMIDGWDPTMQSIAIHNDQLLIVVTFKREKEKS